VARTAAATMGDDCVTALPTRRSWPGAQYLTGIFPMGQRRGVLDLAATSTSGAAIGTMRRLPLLGG